MEDEGGLLGVTDAVVLDGAADDGGGGGLVEVTGGVEEDDCLWNLKKNPRRRKRSK